MRHRQKSCVFERKSFLRIAGCLVLLVDLGLPATAQDCKSTKEVESARGAKLEVVTKWDGVAVYEGPSQGLAKIATLDFGKAYRVYNEHGTWMCLGEADGGPPVGWVERKDLLTDRNAMIHPRTRCHLKVMVRNNLETSGKGYGIFKTHPNGHGKQRRRAGLYEVRYVFAVEDDPNGSTDKVYLAGTGQQWTIDNADKILDGWVSADYVFPWNTRVGVQYSEGLPEPVRIYPKFEDLAPVHCGRESRPWAFSSLDDSSEWRYERERFPVLDEEPGRGCLADRHVLTIGAFGTVTFKKQEMSAGTADVLLTRLNELRGGNQNIDILFVIDGTESVQPVFREVDRAVKEVRDLGALADARYGLAMFKDRKASWPPKVTTRMVDADGLSRELERFLASAGKDTGDPDFEESVLDGVAYALDDMKGQWREKSTRAVVLIGDHGDHRDVGHTERVQKASLAILEHKVRFFAYQTENSRAGNPLADRVYRWFMEDATQLIRGMAGLFSTNVAVARGNANEIKATLKDMREWKIKIDDGYEAIRKGAAPPSEVGPYIRKMLEEVDLDLDQIMGWGNAAQVCHKGFAVLENDKGSERFEKRLRISYEDVGRLVVAFRDFMGNVSSESECKRSMLGALQAATGDNPSNSESPGDFLKRTLGIEVQSDLLSMPLEELAGVLVGQKAARDKLKDALGRSVILLDAVYREEKVDVRPDGTVAVVLDAQGERPELQRWFKVMPDGIRVAWIPVSYIP